MFTRHLIKLYQEMSDLTAPVCASECRVPHSCCDAMYCEAAIIRATEQGETLIRTNHPKLPLMGPTGCTAPPHLRPLCTVHVCCINGLGFKANDPKWTKKYFSLRRKIEDNEFRIMHGT